MGIETPGEGVVHSIVDGMRAVLDAEQLEDLKRHTRRGMRGRIQAGLSAGGLTYGYAPGQDKGKLLLVEHEAAVVRRIFTEYAHGRSPRAIAEGLNADDIRPPRGRGWQASAINGNRVRPLRYPNERALRRAPGLESGFNAQGPGTPAGGCRALIRKKSGSRQRCRICAFVEAELFAKVQAIKARAASCAPSSSAGPNICSPACYAAAAAALPWSPIISPTQAGASIAAAAKKAATVPTPRPISSHRSRRVWWPRLRHNSRTPAP